MRRIHDGGGLCSPGRWPVDDGRQGGKLLKCLQGLVSEMGFGNEFKGGVKEVPSGPWQGEKLGSHPSKVGYLMPEKKYEVGRRGS